MSSASHHHSSLGSTIEASPIAGGEGRFTPALSLPLNVEWAWISSGGKPPFPTCNLADLQLGPKA